MCFELPFGKSCMYDVHTVRRGPGKVMIKLNLKSSQYHEHLGFTAERTSPKRSENKSSFYQYSEDNSYQLPHKRLVYKCAHSVLFKEKFTIQSLSFSLHPLKHLLRPPVFSLRFPLIPSAACLARDSRILFIIFYKGT